MPLDARRVYLEPDAELLDRLVAIPLLAVQRAEIEMRLRALRVVLHGLPELEQRRFAFPLEIEDIAEVRVRLRVSRIDVDRLAILRLRLVVLVILRVGDAEAIVALGIVSLERDRLPVETRSPRRAFPASREASPCGRSEAPCGDSANALCRSPRARARSFRPAREARTPLREAARRASGVSMSSMITFSPFFGFLLLRRCPASSRISSGRASPPSNLLVRRATSRLSSAPSPRARSINLSQRSTANLRYGNANRCSFSARLKHYILDVKILSPQHVVAREAPARETREPGDRHRPNMPR